VIICGCFLRRGPKRESPGFYRDAGEEDRSHSEEEPSQGCHWLCQCCLGCRSQTILAPKSRTKRRSPTGRSAAIRWHDAASTRPKHWQSQWHPISAAFASAARPPSKHRSKEATNCPRDSGSWRVFAASYVPEEVGQYLCRGLAVYIPPLDKLRQLAF
jgi:hypothetical protein